MNNRKTVLLSALTFLLAITPLAAFRTVPAYYEVLAGLSTLIFIFSTSALDRAILKESGSKKLKAVRDFIETFGLFALLSGGLLADIVPLQLAVAMLIVLGVTVAYQMQLSKRFRQSFSFRLGETVWIGVAGLTYLLSSMNLYFLFYGYFLLSLIVLYDLTALFTDLADRPRV